MSQMTNNKQSVKFKKAPNAPKGYKSAYMFYSEHQHKLIRSRSENKKIRAAEVSKITAQSWKQLSDAERAPWIEMGRLDRQRFEREKAAYRGPWKIPDVKDHPDAPKKPMSAFLAFGNERRRAIAKANPQLTSAEISKLLSHLWKECPPHIKKSYIEKEALEREAFKTRRAAWEQEKDRALLSAYMTSTSSTGGPLPTNEHGQSQHQQGIPLRNSAASEYHDELLLSPRRSTRELQALAVAEARAPIGLRTIANAMSSSSDPIENSGVSDKIYSYGSSFEASGPRDSLSSASRLDRLTMDEIMQDDELFEDFAPSSVVGNDSSHPALL